MEQMRPGGFNVLPLAVKNLLIINGLMFLATVVLNESTGFSLYDFLGLHFVTSGLFKPHQLVTHLFMHGDFMHIFSNMFALWMFGSVLENVWGPRRFLVFYFACGLGGALAHLGVNWISYHQIAQDIYQYQLDPGFAQFSSLLERKGKYLHQDSLNEVYRFYQQFAANQGDPALLASSRRISTLILTSFENIPTVGASGAVFGVLVAFGVLFANSYIYVYFLIPVKAKYFVAFYAAFELYAGFTEADGNIAHFAHLGGALVGYLLVRYWNRNLRRNFF